MPEGETWTPDRGPWAGKWAGGGSQLAAKEAEFRDTIFATIEGALWRQLAGEGSWSDERNANWMASLWNASISD